MSRITGLVKRKWRWRSKNGVQEQWSYATRLQIRGKEKLVVHGTQNYGDAITRHQRALAELEEITVEVTRMSESRRFSWPKSTKVADAAREAAAALGCGDCDPGLQRDGDLLQDDAMLVDARLRHGDRLHLVMRLTVDAAHERWRRADLAVRRTERGQRETVARYVRHVSPVIGKKRLDLLTGGDILTLRRVLDAARVAGQRRVLKPETVRHTLSDLRAFLGWAADPAGGNLIAGVPWPRKVMPKIPQRAPRPLSNEEVEAVLGIGEPHVTVIRLGLASGLRWKDLCRVTAQDLKRDASGWYLEVEVAKTGGLLRVPITDTELVQEMRSRIGRLVPFSERSGAVFNRTVRRRSGVASFHVHALRHSYACRYLAGGGSILALQAILGHASVKTTERYARLLHEHVMEDAHRVAESLKSDKSRTTEEAGVVEATS